MSIRCGIANNILCIEIFRGKKIECYKVTGIESTGKYGYYNRNEGGENL